MERGRERGRRVDLCLKKAVGGWLWNFLSMRHGKFSSAGIATAGENLRNRALTCRA